MANTLKLKRSAVQGKIPTTSDLELGELGLNTYDGKAYMKKSVGGVETVVEISGSPSQHQILTTAQIITEDFVVQSGQNALSIESVEIANGIDVTIPSGSTWIVIS
jgi:hypothetical protein|tara:strand:+ start:1558 stop:1875 length:318 start_codon:yes stop_codon:yes gene_type:complete